MSEELRPYIREYGGGYDRWCWRREQFTKELWDLICDGHGGEFNFAEYATEDAAWWALAKACNKMGLMCQLPKMSRTESEPAGKTYRPKPQPPVYVTACRPPDLRPLEAIFTKRRQGERLTKAEVLRLRNEAAIFGGCCDRFADNMGCDCLEEAKDD